VGASRADGYMAKSSDWFIPESRAIPLYIPPPHEEADDEGCDELLSGHMRCSLSNLSESSSLYGSALR